MLKNIAQSVCFTASLIVAICISLWASLPAYADVLVQAHSDLETVAFCSSSGATSSSCSVMDAGSSSNLATGVLAAQADCCDYAGLSSGLASALARFSDTVTLIVPNGYTASTIPSVTFNFSVSGASIGISGPTLSAQHPAATISDFLQVNPATPFAFTGGTASGCDSTDPLDFCGTPNSPLNLSLTLRNIPTANPVFTFTAQLQVSATGFDPGQGVFPKGSGFADAMDPGQLEIDLPQGFSFTSGSGVLLTEASAVPEPSSLILLGSGLAGLGLVRRRRK